MNIKEDLIRLNGIVDGLSIAIEKLHLEEYDGEKAYKEIVQEMRKFTQHLSRRTNEYYGGMQEMTNEEKYKTPEEREEAYHRFCSGRICHECPAHDKNVNSCLLQWLSLEEEKGENNETNRKNQP